MPVTKTATLPAASLPCQTHLDNNYPTETNTTMSTINNTILHSAFQSPSAAPTTNNKMYAKRSYPSSPSSSTENLHPHHHHHHHHQLTSTSSSSSSSPQLLRCKRRVNFGGLPYSIPGPAPVTVARRNERERNRVKQVNMGFATLRQHIPNGAKNKKMSKVDTLRSAVEYISQLQSLLKTVESQTTKHNSSEERCQDESNVRTSNSSDISEVTYSLPVYDSKSYGTPSSYSSYFSQHDPLGSPLSPSSTKSSVDSEASTYDCFETIAKSMSQENSEGFFDFVTLLS